jgi:hypothetical protein
MANLASARDHTFGAYAPIPVRRLSVSEPSNSTRSPPRLVSVRKHHGRGKGRKICHRNYQSTRTFERNPVTMGCPSGLGGVPIPWSALGNVREEFVQY